MRVIITCGPSYEPIDQVRRITNFSTGELGVLLAESGLGPDVLCLKGEAASWRDPRPPVQVAHFSTNDDLLAKLRAIPAPEEIGMVLHAAALADYRVLSVTAAAGVLPLTKKIPSQAGNLTLHLEPTTKVIGFLRPLFPRAWIAGWKYELDGTREVALARGREQIEACQLDACFVNGAAFGSSFVQLQKEGVAAEHTSKVALCAALAHLFAKLSSS